jgi:hypothetical protein
VQSSKPDRAKADELYNRGIHKPGMSITEAHVSYYYYNLYVHVSLKYLLKKSALKEAPYRGLFLPVKMIGDSEYVCETQENLLSYFNGCKNM